jgi:hypothetical protein
MVSRLNQLFQFRIMVWEAMVVHQVVVGALEEEQCLIRLEKLEVMVEVVVVAYSEPTLERRKADRVAVDLR